MSKTRHLSGIVLNKENRREDSQIIYFLSREAGKVEVLIRGARKINSKLAPIVAEPFALLKLVIASGKNNFHLIGGEVKESFRGIFRDEKKIIQTNTLLKKINKLIKNQPDQKIFSLILKFLKKINHLPSDKIQVINNAFLIKFLAFLGYRPEINRCVICQELIQLKEFYSVRNDISKGVIFNLTRGGIVCLKHDLKEENADEKIKISREALTVLQKLLYQDFDSLIKQDFIQKDLQTAERVIKNFFDWHLE